MLTWDQLGIHDKPVVLVNVDGFFDGFLAQLDRAVQDRAAEGGEPRDAGGRVTDVLDALPAARRWRPPPVASKWFRDPVPPRP
ncbi:MAG: LOG family protein [Comamonadaceae bacterium]|nr:LOG family protein [Comamonadaceae bacterium]